MAARALNGLVTCTAYFYGCNLSNNSCECGGASGCSSPFQYDTKEECQKNIDTSIDVPCPLPSCAAPPDNCKYVASNEIDLETGCPMYPCGVLTCEPIDIPCPMPSCAAPPDFCKYVFDNEIDPVTGCPMNPCGKLVCDPIDLPGPCPLPLCVAPEEGCVLNAEKSALLNPETGCPMYPCGYYDCDEPVPCPVVDCEEPEPFCKYTKDDTLDENGCLVFPCGKKECCPIPDCPNPGECMVVPGSVDWTQDEETACPISPCGEIVCSECIDNESCGPDEFCRSKQYEQENGSVLCLMEAKECVPYAQEGDTCGGFVAPCFMSQCAPGLACKGDQIPVDGPGTCQVECVAKPGSGDVNADGSVSVLDVVMAVNLILEKVDSLQVPLACASSAANVNGDNDINILDVINIVSLIL